MSLYRRIGTMLLLTSMVGACFAGTEGDPSGPVDPGSLPTSNTTVGAVLYGWFRSNPAIIPERMTFVVLEADCIQPVQGVTAMNRFEGKRKLTYKYQFRVQRETFEACLRINAYYLAGPDGPLQVAEVTRRVNFTVQGGGLAPVGTQVDIPLVPSQPQP